MILISDRFRFTQLSFSQITDVPGSGLFFIVNEAIIRKYGDSQTTIAVAGGLSGIVMWFVGVPADVIKTRYQTGKPAPHYYTIFLILSRKYVFGRSPCKNGTMVLVLTVQCKVYT